MARWFPWLGAYGLAAVLIVSSLVHLQNPYSFLASIYAYSIVPSWLGIVVAAFLPSLQLTLGLVLLFRPRDWRPSFLVSGVLMLLYTMVQVVALLRGLNISCGCFGRSEGNPIGWLTVSRTALLSLTAFVCYWACRPSDETPGEAPMTSTPA